MSQADIDSLRRELGGDSASLPDLSAVPDAALGDFLEAVRAAKHQQTRLLQESAEHSLRLVPTLLRPAVRKVLFG